MSQLSILVHVFNKPEEQRGTQEYFDRITNSLLHSQSAQEASGCWEKLLVDGLGDNYRYPTVRDFVIDLRTIDCLQDVRFYT